MLGLGLGLGLDEATDAARHGELSGRRARHRRGQRRPREGRRRGGQQVEGTGRPVQRDGDLHIKGLRRSWLGFGLGFG